MHEAQPFHSMGVWVHGDVGRGTLSRVGGGVRVVVAMGLRAQGRKLSSREGQLVCLG